MTEEFTFSQVMLERLYKHNIMPLLITDKSGAFFSSNMKFQDMSGYTDEELKRLTFSSVFMPESPEEKQKFALIEYGFFNDSDAHDVVMVSKDGKRRFVRLWVDAKFDDDLSLAAVEDYTEKREMELQLAKQNVDLSKMKEDLLDFNKKLEAKVAERTQELQKANEEINILLERKNQFINELAHDLRTPLTPITYLIESIKTDEKNPEVLKDLKVMEDNARYLRNLVEDILKLARIDNNKVEFNFEDANLADIITLVCSSNQITFQKLGMTMASKVPETLPLVYVDKLKVTEIFENLVMNATKFMDKGGMLTFHAKESGKFIEIHVKDNGIGIEKEHIPRLFQEFYKVDSARNPKSGTGLGLSICKRLIEKHGGQIWAESDGKGKGTSIIFTLPISKYVSDKKQVKEDTSEDDKRYVEKLSKLAKRG